MKKLLKSSSFLTITKGGLAILSQCLTIDMAKAEDVAIAQFVDHQALNDISSGMEKVFEYHHKTWSKFNAQGNPTTASQIAKSLLGSDAKVMVTLATPMAQSVVASKTNKSIIFGAVTDPKAAKLTEKSNVTGVTDYVPVSKIIEMITLELPNIKTIGSLYNPGESNSTQTISDMKQACGSHGIKMIETTASKSSDVSTAFNYLIGKIDVLLIPLDNTIVTSLDTIISLADHYKIPVIAMDTKTVEKGVLFAYGVDWESIGEEIGERAIAILNGASIKDIPISSPKNYKLVINRKKAGELNIKFSEDFYKKADLIID